MTDEQLKNAVREASYEIRDFLTFMRVKLGEEKVMEFIGEVNARALIDCGYVLIKLDGGTSK